MSTGQVPPIDPDIERLDLAPVAKAAAYALKRRHPAVVFTSGRRDTVAQARAMASNVMKRRRWIVETYRDSPARAACQKWVDEHPAATTQAQIQEGLLTAFASLPPDQLGGLSKHLAGMAFDVQPIHEHAAEITATIRTLDGLELFLDREGGLERWHAEFK